MLSVLGPGGPGQRLGELERRPERVGRPAGHLVGDQVGQSAREPAAGARVGERAVAGLDAQLGAGQR